MSQCEYSGFDDTNFLPLYFEDAISQKIGAGIYAQDT